MAVSASVLPSVRIHHLWIATEQVFRHLPCPPRTLLLIDDIRIRRCVHTATFSLSEVCLCGECCCVIKPVDWDCYLSAVLEEPCPTYISRASGDIWDLRLLPCDAPSSGIPYTVIVPIPSWCDTGGCIAVILSTNIDVQ